MSLWDTTSSSVTGLYFSTLYSERNERLMWANRVANAPRKVCYVLWRWPELGDGLCLALCGALHDRKRVVYLLISFCSGHARRETTRTWRGLKAVRTKQNQTGRQPSFLATLFHPCVCALPAFASAEDGFLPLDADLRKDSHGQNKFVSFADRISRRRD